MQPTVQTSSPPAQNRDALHDNVDLTLAGLRETAKPLTNAIFKLTDAQRTLREARASGNGLAITKARAILVAANVAGQAATIDVMLKHVEIITDMVASRAYEILDEAQAFADD